MLQVILLAALLIIIPASIITTIIYVYSMIHGLARNNDYDKEHQTEYIIGAVFSPIILALSIYFYRKLKHRMNFNIWGYKQLYV